MLRVQHQLQNVGRGICALTFHDNWSDWLCRVYSLDSACSDSWSGRGGLVITWSSRCEEKHCCHGGAEFTMVKSAGTEDAVPVGWWRVRRLATRGGPEMFSLFRFLKLENTVSCWVMHFLIPALKCLYNHVILVLQCVGAQAKCHVWDPTMLQKSTKV